MQTIAGGIEELSSSILNEAQAEIEQLKKAAQAGAEETRKRAQSEAERERSSILQTANEQARLLRRQTAANAQLKARTSELDHREQLLQQVFSAAAERLRAVPQQAEFGEIIQRLAHEALAELHAGSAELLVDGAGQRALTKEVLERLARETSVKLGEVKPLTGATGVIAQTPDGRLRFDNTLETRLSRLQGPLRAGVFQILIGARECASKLEP